MQLNRFTPNGAGINAGAFVFALALASARAGATASVEPVRTTYASAPYSAGATASAEAVLTKYASATESAGVSASITPTHIHADTATTGSAATGIASGVLERAAGASFSAGASGTAYQFTTFFASFGGECFSELTALPNAALGEVDATAGADGTAEAVRSHFAAASVTASADPGIAVGDVTRYVSVGTVVGTGAGFAEWTYKANGTTVWQHDGHCSATGDATLAVDETKYKIVITNGWIQTGECAGTAEPTWIGRPPASGAAGCQASVQPLLTRKGGVAASASGTVTVTATYQHRASVAATGSVIATVAGLGRFIGATTGQSAVTGSAQGVRIKIATAAAAPAGCAVSLSATRITLAEAAFAGTCTASAEAVENLYAESLAVFVRATGTYAFQRPRTERVFYRG